MEYDSLYIDVIADNGFSVTVTEMRCLWKKSCPFIPPPVEVGEFSEIMLKIPSNVLYVCLFIDNLFLLHMK